MGVSGPSLLIAYQLHDFDGAFSYVYMQRSLCMDAQEKIFDCNIQWNKCERTNNIVILNIQLIFMVAIRLLKGGWHEKIFIFFVGSF